MNVNINIPGLSQYSEMGIRVNYLNNCIQQWNNLGFNDSHNYSESANNLLAQMVALLIIDVESPEAKTLYNNNINAIETNKTNAFEEWEASIRDVYINPGPFELN